MLLSLIRRIFKPLFVVAIVAVSVWMTLAAVFDSSSAQAHQATPLKATAPTTVADVSIINFGYVPAVLTVTAGTTVRWTNTAALTPHTSTSDAGSTEVWDSLTINPSGVFTHTFDTPGIYGYFCTIHGAALMHGFIVVIQPPTDVTIAGPIEGTIDTPHVFTATVSPITATLPITYLWKATGQSNVTHVGGLSDTIVFTWPAGTSVTQLITATAVNDGGAAAGTHFIFFTPPHKVYLPLVMNVH